jgi:hypothetical protein
MFDQILGIVKEQLGNHPEAKAAVPQQQANAVEQEIASHVENQVKNQAIGSGGGGIGDLLSSLAGASSSSPVTNAITGGLVSSLASKFGLPPAATGAIAAALPGILQKFAHKTNDPNDNSLTPDSILGSLTGGKGLGGLF